MIIDSHQHVFWHGRDDAGLVADLDEQGIDFAWLLSWDVPQDEGVDVYRHVFNPARFANDGSHPGLSLGDIVTAKRRFPDRFVCGYLPDPRVEGAPAVFETAYHMHGVRVCGEWKLRMLFDDPRCLELFRKAGELACPVVLHLDAPFLMDSETQQVKYQRQWYGGTVANLERALNACPDTIFIGHAPGFWREISGDADADSAIYPSGPLVPGGRLVPLFERCPNLYADLSAGSALQNLKRDPAWSQQFLSDFADRLLFGRDYYGGDLQEYLATLDLPTEVRDQLYFANALRLAGEPL